LIPDRLTARPARLAGRLGCRPDSYCMDAATMSLELHERGIHAV